MIVVAGHLQVDPDRRRSYLQDCQALVRRARGAPGCLDFALSADLLDPARINVLECWETVADVEAFRGAGPAQNQAAHVRAADVKQFEVVASETL